MVPARKNSGETDVSLPSFNANAWPGSVPATITLFGLAVPLVRKVESETPSPTPDAPAGLVLPPSFVDAALFLVTVVGYVGVKLGDSVPILESLAPDRGVTLPFKGEAVV